jgi:hypothetical protein
VHESDNLREGVLVPDVYDPALNPLYREALAHYGAVAMPCRIQDPDRKGKVESGVGHAQKTPLKGLRFESLEQAFFRSRSITSCAFIIAALGSCVHSSPIWCAMLLK